LPESPAKRLAHDFGLKAVVATEIEFYLHGAAARLSPEGTVGLIETACGKAGITLACAETERGPDQYEISLMPADDIAQIAADTERCKTGVTDAFARHEIRADFAAKPMRDVPGSGLHVHVHLEDGQGRNMFFREGESFSPLLLHSIGGLLAFMNPCMPVFAPTEPSYDRFLHTVNAYLLCPTAANVPLTVSWGTNNRTVAVRLPSKAMDNKHIEHRVAGSDANVAAVIDAVLAGIHYGLKEKCHPGEPTYGDATLAQYGLPPLARSYSEAMRHRNECAALKDYFDV
jgi:glutamine synthetase